MLRLSPKKTQKFKINKTIMTTHKEKVKIARKLMTPFENKIGVSKWDSVAWRKRKEVIRSRVERKQAMAHQRAVMRKKSVARMSIES